MCRVHVLRIKRERERIVINSVLMPLLKVANALAHFNLIKSNLDRFLLWKWCAKVEWKCVYACALYISNYTVYIRYGLVGALDETHWMMFGCKSWKIMVHLCDDGSSSSSTSLSSRRNQMRAEWCKNDRNTFLGNDVSLVEPRVCAMFQWCVLNVYRRELRMHST